MWWTARGKGPEKGQEDQKEPGRRSFGIGTVGVWCDGFELGGKHVGVGGSTGKQHGRLFDARRRGAVMGKPVVCEHHEDGGEKGNPVRWCSLCSCYIFRSRRIRLDEAFVLLFTTPFCNLLRPSRSRNYVVPFLSYIFRDLYLLGDASVLSSRFVSSGIFFVLGVSGLEPDVVLLLLLFIIAFFFKLFSPHGGSKRGHRTPSCHTVHHPAKHASRPPPNFVFSVWFGSRYPPDPLYSHHVRNSHFSHCLWLAPNYLAPQTPGPLWSPAMLRIKNRAWH